MGYGECMTQASYFSFSPPSSSLRESHIQAQLFLIQHAGSSKGDLPLKMQQGHENTPFYQLLTVKNQMNKV